MNDPALDVDNHKSRTTSIAARGSLVFVGFEDTTSTASGYGVSNDGGATFGHMRIQAPSDTFYYGSPSVAIGPAGEVYYAFLVAPTGTPRPSPSRSPRTGARQSPPSGILPRR